MFCYFPVWTYLRLIRKVLRSRELRCKREPSIKRAASNWYGCRIDRKYLQENYFFIILLSVAGCSQMRIPDTPRRMFMSKSRLFEFVLLRTRCRRVQFLIILFIGNQSFEWHFCPIRQDYRGSGIDIKELNIA